MPCFAPLARPSQAATHRGPRARVRPPTPSARPVAASRPGPGFADVRVHAAGRSEPRLQRAMLYPEAKVTEPDDDPIRRHLGNDDSLALTTLTINGSTDMSDARLAQVFFPTAIEKKAAACGFKNFDVRISANMRLPKAPADGRWGPNEVERRTIRRPGLPAECAAKERISVVMKGDPDSKTLYDWLLDNEDQHRRDMQRAAERWLAPEHQRILALRGSGADDDACAADLRQQLAQIPNTNVATFLQTVRSDIAGRDVPGGHKFDVTAKARNRCDNLEFMLKKTPAPARRRP